jgi:hypothetical protein
MALTIRATAEEEQLITLASKMLNEKSASKTLLRCAGLAVGQRDTIRQQGALISKLEKELWNIKEAYREKMMVGSILASLLQNDE